MIWLYNRFGDLHLIFKVTPGLKLLNLCQMLLVCKIISVRVILQLCSAVFFDHARLPLHNSTALRRNQQRSTSIAMAQSKKKWRNLETTDSYKAFKYLHSHLSKFKTHLCNFVCNYAGYAFAKTDGLSGGLSQIHAFWLATCKNINVLFYFFISITATFLFNKTKPEMHLLI